MPATKKGDSKGKKGKSMSALEKTLLNPLYETFTLFIIGFNCITLALADPLRNDADQKPYLGILGWIFSFIYLADVVLHLVAMGLVNYLHNSWHYLDLVVGCVSLIEFSIVIISGLGKALGLGALNPSDGFKDFLNILQILRVLRPLKAFNFMPSLMAYLMACAKSARDVIVNIGFLFFCIAVISTYCNYLIGERLRFRCVPEDLESTNVLNNIFYQEYGTKIFYTKYNTDFCGGEKVCQVGFACVNINIPFETVPADFGNPWYSFISCLSFLTLRGWPNIFWAISDAGYTWRATIVLFIMFTVGYVMIVNLFPAIFIASLRKEEERVQKLNWLMYYPGNLDAVTELELLVWVSCNKRELDSSMNAHADISIPTRIYRALRRAFQTEAYDKAMLKLKADIDDAQENDPDFLDPSINIGKIPWRPCVPHLHAWDILRSYIIPDTSVFNFVVIGLVCFNIVLLSMDSNDPSDFVIMFQFWGDIVCNIVFAFELLAKLFLLGPCLYLDSAFNVLDMFLVCLGLAKYVTDVPGFITNLRVIKLLRLLRLYRVAKLVDTAKDPKGFKDATITVGGLAGLVVDMSEALLNTMLVSFLLLYIFALVGMKFFVHGQSCYSGGLTIGCGLEPIDPTVPTVIPYDLSNSFGGSYSNRMNFNSFGNAFETVFNVMFLNNWYNIMIQTMLQYGGTLNVWFFISAVFMLNYFSVATLMSAATNVLESHAEQQLVDEAHANKTYLNRVFGIRMKMVARVAFKLWRKNTVNWSEESKANTGAVFEGAHHQLGDVEEILPPKNVFQRFFNSRDKYSFYLFQDVAMNPDGKIRHGHIRHTLAVIMKSMTFNGILWLATMFVVALSLSDGSASVIELKLPNLICSATFIAEMMMKMTIDGFFNYFTNMLNILDFLNNGIMITSILLPEYKLFTQFRVIRLVKFPDIIRSFSQTHSLNMIIAALYSSPRSIGNLIIVGLVIVYFFAVIGLQTWLGMFGYCSYDMYPSGQEKTEPTATFPEGCSGIYNTKNIFGAYSITKITWKTHIDSFDDIFKSFRSCFKVFINNDWQGILYNAEDVTGVNLEPKETGATTSFFFFMILAYIALTLSVMFLSIFYYHYIMVSLRHGRKLISSESTAMWQRIEERLMNISMMDNNIWGENEPPKSNPLRHALWRLFRGQKYNWLVSVFCISPMLCVLFAFNQTYARPQIIYYDICFTIAYLSEYIARVFVLRKLAFSTKLGKQEFVVCCGLSYMMTYLIQNMENPGERATFLLCMSCVLRCFRLFYVSMSLNALTKTLRIALSGTIPTFLYYVTLVLIYAVLGVMTMSDLKPDFGVAFLNERYHFQTYISAVITLMAVGSGNMYSELIEKLSEGTTGMTLFINIYFLSFYTMSNIIMKSFALMIIAKYLMTSGGTIGLAGQQIRQFKFVWKYANKDNPTADILKLKQIVQLLPHPLGINGETNKFVLVERFLKKVLLSMPSAVDHFDDFDVTKQRLLFSEENLPENIWTHEMPQFTFKQCIVSLHKNFLHPVKLYDEREFLRKRENAIIWLSLLRQNFSRLLVEDSTPEESRETEAAQMIIACKNSLNSQRLEPEVFQRQFLFILSQRIKTLRSLILSLGFGPYQSWSIKNVRNCLRLEEHAARLRMTVAKRVYTTMFDKELGRQVKNRAQLYHSKVRHMLAECNHLYMSFIRLAWNPESLTEVIDLKQRVAISAVYVDSISNVYIACGKCVYIYLNTSSNPDVSANTQYRKMKPIQLNEPVASMTVSVDSKQIYVGGSSDVYIFSLEKARRGIPSEFKREAKPLIFHQDKVAALCFVERRLVSCSLDETIVLWDMQSGSPENTYSAGSGVYCLSIMNLKPPTGQPIDEVPLKQVIVAGCKNGNIVVLPIPLKESTRLRVKNNWDAIIVQTDLNIPVACISSAWNFLYAGYADGSIRVWSISTNTVLKESAPVTTSMFGVNVNTLKSAFSIQNYLKFIEVDKKYVHTGAVTGLLFTGETLFSCSHDYSFLSYSAPENLNAKTPGYFKQAVGKGLVIHNDHITSMYANKFLIVSGDNSGHVKISIPAVMSEVLMRDNLGGVKSDIRFSWLEYDFNLSWCGHQSVRPEEECYLSIKNDSIDSIQLRCLHDNDPNFRVELASSSFRAISVKRATKIKKMYEVQCKQTIVFRVVFFPAEEISYSNVIEFLINEKDIVKIHVRGTGVRPKVSLDNLMEEFDFGNVDVGLSKKITMDVTNHSVKDISTNLVEMFMVTNDKLTNSSDSWRFSQRQVTVTPRSFKIGARQTIRMSVQFSPMKAYSSFEFPLIFSLAGANYTLTKCRMRSSLTKMARDFVENAEAGIIPDKALSGTNTFGPNIEPIKPAQASNTARLITHRLQPPFLRELSDTENICHKGHIAEILTGAGWQLVLEDDLAVFVHKISGLFLEVPKYSENQLSKCSEPVDKLKITFSNGSKKLYYEVWFLHNLLAKGFAEPDTDVLILVKSEKLIVHAMYTVDGKFDEYKMDASHLLLVELLIFSVGESERNPDWELDRHVPCVKTLGPNRTQEEGKQFGSLISASFIRVHKGYRVARTGAGKEFAFLDRLIVGGIERILSYSDTAMLYLDESFGEHRDKQGNVINTGSPLFAHVSLVIDSNAIKEIITHFRVKSNVVEVVESVEQDLNNKQNDARNMLHKQSDNRRSSVHGFMHGKCGGEGIAVSLSERADEVDFESVSNSYAAGDIVDVKKVNVTFGETVTDLSSTTVDHTHMINSITGMEKIEIVRPEVTNKRPNYDTSRSFDVSTERSHHFRGKVENTVIGDVIHLSAHTAHGIISRARATRLSPRALYPYEVFSSQYSIICGVVEPVDDQTGQDFNEKGEPIQSDSILNTHKIGSAIDKVMLDSKNTTQSKIISGDLFFGQWYFVSDNYDLHIISAEVAPIGSFSRVTHDNELDNEQEFAKNAASENVVASTSPCTDIQFTCHGFHAKLEDNTELHCASGFAASTEGSKNASETVAKNYRTFDFDGDPVLMLEASPKLLAIYSKIMRYEMLKRIKGAFERLLLQKHAAQRAEKAKQAGRLVAAFEEKLENDMSHSGSNKMNSIQLKEQMRVLQEAERIKSADHLTSTPADVYSHIVERVSAFHFEEMELQMERRMSPVTESESKSGAISNLAPTNKLSAGGALGRLLVPQLVKYLVSVTLPGFETPMTKPEVDCALRSMGNETIPEVGCVVPRDGFMKWYTTMEDPDDIALLNSKSLFPLLLEEFLQSQGAYKSEERDAVVKNIDPSTATAEIGSELLKRKKRKGGLTNRMSVLWNKLSRNRDEGSDTLFEKTSRTEMSRKEFEDERIPQTMGSMRRASQRFASFFGGKSKQSREHNIISQAANIDYDNINSNAVKANSKDFSFENVASDDVPMQVLRARMADNQSLSQKLVKEANLHDIITPEASETGSNYSTDEESATVNISKTRPDVRVECRVAEEVFADEESSSESDGEGDDGSYRSLDSVDAFISDTESSDDEMRL